VLPLSTELHIGENETELGQMYGYKLMQPSTNNVMPFLVMYPDN
jgi:hypothetical protein